VQEGGGKGESRLGKKKEGKWSSEKGRRRRENGNWEKGTER